MESCGFIADLNALVGPSGEVRSIDIQEDTRYTVAARKRGVGGMIGTFRYDYTNDIPDEAFDIVINLQGIQHTDDWTATGNEFLRIMKSGRRLVMAEIVLGSRASDENKVGPSHPAPVRQDFFSAWICFQ